MTVELDNLYRDYQEICDDRGAFAKPRRILHQNSEADWLNYVIALIAGYPSREERAATIQEEDARRGPGRKRGDI